MYEDVLLSTRAIMMLDHVHGTLAGMIGHDAEKLLKLQTDQITRQIFRGQARRWMSIYVCQSPCNAAMVTNCVVLSIGPPCNVLF